MKYSLIINIMICFFLLSISSGCERAEIQKSSVRNNEKITPRVEDCESCPNVDDCCCSVTFLSGSTSTYKLCGTTDGDAVNCSVDEVCNGTINGLEHTLFTLNSTTNTHELFCMAPNTAFAFANVLGGAASIQLTCQHGQTSPQTVNVVFTGPGRKYYAVNGDCEVSECH
jgi:hypothetical protein